MKNVTGKAITEDNWTVICPRCGKETEYEGFFEPYNEVCICGCLYHIEKIQFANGDYIH